MDFSNQLQKIAHELEAQPVYDEYARKLQELTTPFMNIAVAEQVLPPDGSDIKKAIPEEWLKAHKIRLEETSLADDDGDLKPLVCDVCLLEMNVTCFLTKTELEFIKHLHDMNIITIVVPSKVETITEKNLNELYDFARKRLGVFETVKLLELRKELKASGGEICAAVEKFITEKDVKKAREAQRDMLLVSAVGQLYEICRRKMEEADKLRGKMEEEAEEERRKLEEKTDDWKALEEQLRQRMNDIYQSICATMVERNDDIVANLSHCVDLAGDVKLFWEKDFPYRLAEIMKGESAAMTQRVNRELTNTMQWLKDELFRLFKSKITFSPTIEGEYRPAREVDGSNVEVADTNHLKIVARVGTAATVVAAGVLFASTGIGGIAMAASMMSGIGAEYFMRRKQDESREDIKRSLPGIVSNAQQSYLNVIEEKTQEMTGELISNLSALKAEWHERSEKEIALAKTIKINNAKLSRWDTVMAQINQLSEIILKQQ